MTSTSRTTRALLYTLAVLLQVALLPGVGRLRCVLRTGSSSCCCAVAARANAPQLPAHDCCRKAEPIADPAYADRSGCTCGHDLEPLPIAPNKSTAGEASADPVAAPPAPLPAAPPADRGAEAACAAAPVPRHATGPPLFVLYEVFLI